MFAESWRRRLVVPDGAAVETRVVLHDLADGEDDCTVLQDHWPVVHDVLDGIVGLDGGPVPGCCLARGRLARAQWRSLAYTSQ